MFFSRVQPGFLITVPEGSGAGSLKEGEQSARSFRLSRDVGKGARPRVKGTRNGSPHPGVGFRPKGDIVYGIHTMPAPRPC